MISSSFQRGKRDLKGTSCCSYLLFPVWYAYAWVCMCVRVSFKVSKKCISPLHQNFYLSLLWTPNLQMWMLCECLSCFVLLFLLLPFQSLVLFTCKFWATTFEWIFIRIWMALKNPYTSGLIRIEEYRCTHTLQCIIYQHEFSASTAVGVCVEPRWSDWLHLSWLPLEALLNDQKAQGTQTAPLLI